MTTLADLRTRLRQDLKDEDPTAYRWTDDELDRHLDHAVRTYSNYHAAEQVTELATTAGSRAVSLSSLTSLLRVLDVEYPIGSYPTERPPFTVWANTLHLQTDRLPTGDTVRVSWLKAHTVDASGSTLPPAHEDLVVTGAVGYAAEAWASYAANRVNVDPAAVQHYAELGLRRLAEFWVGLQELTRRRQLQVRRLHA